MKHETQCIALWAIVTLVICTLAALAGYRLAGGWQHTSTVQGVPGSTASMAQDAPGSTATAVPSLRYWWLDTLPRCGTVPQGRRCNRPASRRRKRISTMRPIHRLRRKVQRQHAASAVLWTRTMQRDVAVRAQAAAIEYGSMRVGLPHMRALAADAQRTHERWLRALDLLPDL